MKEKEFAESAKLMIENQFPQLRTTIISEGGFISNPEIHASPSIKDYPIRDLLLKYKVYGSGKHRKQDLLLSAQIISKSSGGDFSVIVKREGFFRRVFGGENVQLGHQSLDDRLFIRASNPASVQSYLSENNFHIAAEMANVSDLKECKLDYTGNSISVVIRSDHTNIRYVGALLGLVSALANVDSLYPKPQERSGFRTTTRKAFERIPHRKQRFKDLPRVHYEGSLMFKPESSIDKTVTSTQDTSLFEKVKDKILEKSYLDSDQKISDTSAELTFNIGYFRTINIEWDDKTISATGAKELSVMPFQILMKRLSRTEEKLGFHNPFQEIEVKTDPKELSDSLKERTEIARTFNSLIGDFPAKIEIISNKKTVSFSIKAPTLPENIDPIYGLIKSIGWFLEFSFL